MRTLTNSLALLLVLTLTNACSERKEVATTESPATTQKAALSPEELGTLGAQIHNSPDRANELLSEHGLDEVSFEKAIRDVTENAEASKRYAEAYRKNV
jgi:hypothetical protein